MYVLCLLCVRVRVRDSYCSVCLCVLAFAVCDLGAVYVMCVVCGCFCVLRVVVCALCAVCAVCVVCTVCAECAVCAVCAVCVL